MWSWEGFFIGFRFELDDFKEVGVVLDLMLLRNGVDSRKVILVNFYLGNERIKVGVDYTRYW